MEQQKLESRVQDIFQSQGFELEKTGTRFVAEKDEVSKQMQVFSSEEYSREEVPEQAEPGHIVFIDEGLEEVHSEIENEVSIVGEIEDREEYDLPSYELIGDIAVINELTVPEDETVQGIREHHPHVETILLKEEPLEGEFRVGGYSKLYGEKTETTHTEFGCCYRVDPTKAYFSERLATERKRVADRVEPGEKVLVIGAGVGPYPILIARVSEPGNVVAVEKNPEAVKFLRENIELNSVSNVVEVVEGDAREVEFGDKFDRVVIAAPEFADRFLETAAQNLENGGLINYYSFREGENWSAVIDEIRAALPGDAGFEVLEKVVCGQRGPDVDRVCIDLQVTKQPDDL
ncbi:MAG: class I SAM-dependent methyltransferase family protein [Candidatus Nanohaloarchaea archaeon]